MSKPPAGRRCRIGLAVMLGAGPALLPVPGTLAGTAIQAEPPAPTGPGEAPASESARPEGTEAGAARVQARDVAGEAGAAVPLRVEVVRGPGRSSSSVYILDLPKGARLSDTGHAVTAAEERTVINVTDWNLSDLAVTPQPERTGTFTLAVVAMTYPENGRPLSIARSTFALRVRPPQVAAAMPAAEPATAEPTTAEAPREDAPTAIPASLAGPEPDARAAEAAPEPVRIQALVVPGPVPGTAPPPARTTPREAVVPRPTSEPASGLLMERAERLIRLGDISGARLVLERAMARGDPRAAFRLAQTCDPQVLRTWKVQGLQPDPERARALYARAAREGLPEARGLADAVR